MFPLNFALEYIHDGGKPSGMGVQGAIPVTGTKPATTHDNACTAILWRLEGVLRHVSRRKIV
ncbi:hypothetical protein AA18889_2598 [Acetobacter senegalensis DSM 18889]|nr:hypothetical protein AA18889_2598 [Acetobacter senegalensis DSM 18889]